MSGIFSYGCWWERVMSCDDDEFIIESVTSPDGKTMHCIDPLAGYPRWLEMFAATTPTEKES